MRKPGDLLRYIPDNPETDEAMAMSGLHVVVMQTLRERPEGLYDVLVLDSPFIGTRMAANESDLENE